MNWWAYGLAFAAGFGAGAVFTILAVIYLILREYADNLFYRA